MNSSPAQNFRPKLWVAGDLNAFFGLFTNVLLNVMVLSSLALFVVNLPGETVYGRILPALGVALPLGNLFYAWMAWQMAKKQGRSNVTALPYGPSVPHMFIVVFVVMLPSYLTTKDPILAWKLGLIWAFIVGLIVLLGAFVGPVIRKYTPRAAMLGTLAGISIAFIALRPAFQMFDGAWIGRCFGGFRLGVGCHGSGRRRAERHHGPASGQRSDEELLLASTLGFWRCLFGSDESGLAATRDRDSARDLQLYRSNE